MGRLANLDQIQCITCFWKVEIGSGNYQMIVTVGYAVMEKEEIIVLLYDGQKCCDYK